MLLATQARNGRVYQIPDLAGLTFGRLVVSAYAEKRGKLHYWLCRCECGTTKTVEGWALRKGITQSCGCRQREIVSKRGPAHWHYRGGKSHDANGYVTITSKGHVGTGRREHRVVMERYLKRSLNRDEIVHHRDGDKTNNAIENLEVMTRAAHGKHHHG
jgi:hypothetical protein